MLGNEGVVGKAVDECDGDDSDAAMSESSRCARWGLRSPSGVKRT